jgi:hypothetical protein
MLVTMTDIVLLAPTSHDRTTTIGANIGAHDEQAAAATRTTMSWGHAMPRTFTRLAPLPFGWPFLRVIFLEQRDGYKFWDIGWCFRGERPCDAAGAFCLYVATLENTHRRFRTCALSWLPA